MGWIFQKFLLEEQNMGNYIEKYLGVTINVDESAIEEYNVDGKNVLKEIRTAIASSLTLNEISILRERSDLTSEEIKKLDELEKQLGDQHVSS